MPDMSPEEAAEARRKAAGATGAVPQRRASDIRMEAARAAMGKAGSPQHLAESLPPDEQQEQVQQMLNRGYVLQPDGSFAKKGDTAMGFDPGVRMEYDPMGEKARRVAAGDANPNDEYTVASIGNMVRNAATHDPRQHRGERLPPMEVPVDSKGSMAPPSRGVSMQAARLAAARKVMDDNEHGEDPVANNLQADTDLQKAIAQAQTKYADDPEKQQQAIETLRALYGEPTTEPAP